MKGDLAERKRYHTLVELRRLVAGMGQAREEQGRGRCALGFSQDMFGSGV